MIRPATVHDIPFIDTLTRSLVVTREEPRSGFVEMPVPDTRGWVQRVANNQYFYLAMEQEPTGFVAAYSNVRLSLLYPNQDPLISHILSKEKPFVYFDMIAVAPTHQRTGIAQKLEERVFSLASTVGVRHCFGVICHAPRNEPSIAFHERLGWVFKEEIDHAGLTFGVYHKPL